uniref:hypothetical protein n=1 Tax=Trebonia sp. TaxID=2767075 RepID=UPI0026027A4C
MRTWAQRTARWTARTLPFSLGRAGGRDLAATASASATATATAGFAERPGDRAPRQPLHARGPVAPARGRHAAA